MLRLSYSVIFSVTPLCKFTLDYAIKGMVTYFLEEHVYCEISETCVSNSLSSSKLIICVVLCFMKIFVTKSHFSCSWFYAFITVTFPCICYS